MNWDGKKIKEAAASLSLSLTDLASGVGVSRQTVNDWVKGQVPKGNHLLALARLLKKSPNYFFNQEPDKNIIIPVHRQRLTAKYNNEMEEESLALAHEFKIFFQNNKSSSILPVIRMQDSDFSETKKIAEELRARIGVSEKDPINFFQVFKLMEVLGIYIIFHTFPEKVKSYAFYTRIYNHRVVFVNSATNIIDLIFPLLHESIHALRDEVVQTNGYDEFEENLCNMVASYIQLPETYVELVYNTIKTLPKAHQINSLKNFGQHYYHSLYGIVSRIKDLHPEFKLNVGGADTNLKKEFPTIGEYLLSKPNLDDYVGLMYDLSPHFFRALTNQLDSISDRKLAFLLGLEYSLDIKVIRKKLRPN